MCDMYMRHELLPSVHMTYIFSHLPHKLCGTFQSRMGHIFIYVTHICAKKIVYMLTYVYTCIYTQTYIYVHVYVYIHMYQCQYEPQLQQQRQRNWRVVLRHPTVSKFYQIVRGLQHVLAVCLPARPLAPEVSVVFMCVT